MSIPPSLAERITAFLDGIPSLHWPAAPDSYPNDSWWDVDGQPRMPANQQVRLGQLRRSAFDAAITRHGAAFKVVLYANTTMGDPAHSLAAAEAYAYECGWHIVGRFVDVTANPQPWAREEWPKVLRTLRGGFAQGVVTDDRSAVSVADEPYEQTLHWLFDHFSFVAHARPRPTAPAVAR
jgi:hypothetical protein